MDHSCSSIASSDASRAEDRAGRAECVRELSVMLSLAVNTNPPIKQAMPTFKSFDPV